VPIVLQHAHVEDAHRSGRPRLLEVQAQTQRIFPVENKALGSAAIRITEHLIDALEAERDAVLVQRGTTPPRFPSKVPSQGEGASGGCDCAIDVVDQATASAAASRSCAGVLSGGVRRICPGHILLSHGAEPLEITRPPYLRKGLRYASDVTNRSAYWNRLLASIALITYCTAFYSESHQGKQAGHAGHAYTRDGQTVRFGAHRVAAFGCASWLVSPAAPDI
jgi:hypothetical protein